MPQLKTAIWMFLFLITWFAYMVLVFPMTINHCTPSNPTAINMGTKESGAWPWWWE